MNPGNASATIDLMVAKANAAHAQAAAIVPVPLEPVQTMVDPAVAKDVVPPAFQTSKVPSWAELAKDSGIPDSSKVLPLVPALMKDPGTLGNPKELPQILQGPDPRIPGNGEPPPAAPGTVIGPEIPSYLPPFAPSPSVFAPSPSASQHVVSLSLLMDDPLFVLEPVAIALAGGGTIGDFELGALLFIYDQFMGSDAGIDAGFARPRPDIVTGTSTGAVNAASISQGGGAIEELKYTWFQLRTNADFYTLNGAVATVINKAGQLRGPAIAKMIRDGLIGLAVSGLLPHLGFLSLGALGFDVETLYALLVSQPSIFNLGAIFHTFGRVESYWSPTGPGLRGAGISVARDLDGHRIVFARGYDDELYARWQVDTSIPATARWSLWHALDQAISSDPVAYTTGFSGNSDIPTRVGVIARTADEQNYGGRTLVNGSIVRDHPTPDPFQPWANIPNQRRYSSQPTIIQQAPNGHPWAFCRDQDLPWLQHGQQLVHPYIHRSYYSRWDGNSWTAWTMFGQYLPIASPDSDTDIAGNITGCSCYDPASSAGTLELFTRDSNYNIMSSFTHDGSAPQGWTYWVGEGYNHLLSATSDLLVIRSGEAGPDVIDVFWRGIDGRVWTRRKVYTSSLAPWGNERCLGCFDRMITSNLSSGRNPDGTYTILARGLDDRLQGLRQPFVNADWQDNAWFYIGAPEGLTILGDPYTLTVGPATSGPVEIYAVASDYSVWTNQLQEQPDGTYGPGPSWFSLGGKVWTGIKLRMSTVALETGQDRFVEEAGRFLRNPEEEKLGWSEPIISSNGDIRGARSKGVIASCTAPAVFPAVPLNGQTWVDGGMRRGVPIGAAIDGGARRVIAIATVPTKVANVTRILAPTLHEPNPSVEEFINNCVGQPPESRMIRDYAGAGMIDVLVRSFVELLIDATSLAELYPETPWRTADGKLVPVWVIQQTFKTHEGATIDPGLIRINFSYGWMRAFDMLVASDDQRTAAMESTDTIIRARWEAWKAEARFREALLTAASSDANIRAVNAVFAPAAPVVVASDWAHTLARDAAPLAIRALTESRNKKRELRDALAARRDSGFPLDPESPQWLTEFEMYAPQEHWESSDTSYLLSPDMAAFHSPFQKLDFRSLDGPPVDPNDPQRSLNQHVWAETPPAL